MLLQSSSSAAIFPYFKYFNPRKFISTSFSKRFFENKDFSSFRFNLGKWPPIVSALKALLHKKWYLFRLKQLSRCLVYNAIVFINVGQMMMVGSSSWLNTPWPLQYLLQIERWFLWTWLSAWLGICRNERFFLYIYVYECDKVLSLYVWAIFKHVPFSGQFCLDVAGCVCVWRDAIWGHACCQQCIG